MTNKELIIILLEKNLLSDIMIDFGEKAYNIDEIEVSKYNGVIYLKINNQSKK